MTKGYFEIWQPRYHDSKVLLATKKVLPEGINVVKFTKAKAWNGRYSIRGSQITDCPIESNGSISCYAVPLDRLVPIPERSNG